MIDEKDKKILSSLLIDGRSSYADIGKNVGLTRQTVYSRIKSLKKKGYIKKFSTKLDLKKLNLKLKAYILLKASTKKELRKEAEKKLKRIPQISQMNYLYGQFDILLEVIVRDIDELTSLLKRLHEMQVVEKTETLMVYDIVKYKPEDPVKRVLNE
jgi:DNA-binding Lrp family transcriptional regulator